MQLDAKGRKKRAQKAGKASGRSRRRGKAKRDANIVLAFDYLEGKSQAEEDWLKAYRFLQQLGHGVSLPPGVAPLRFLAEAIGLSRTRVWQIVQKSQSEL